MKTQAREPETVGDVLDNLPAGNAVTRIEPSPVTPLTMIDKALSSNASVDTIEKLMALQERWEANEARKAFVVAMAGFKANPPKIEKNKAVSYGAGNKTAYTHATLDHICDVVGPALAKHGLSFRWETEQGEGGLIKVTCILQHNLGHCERTHLQANPDTSGSKNHVQAIGSTTSYLSRYTLTAALGLSTSDIDDDGSSSEPGERGDTEFARSTISPERIALLQEGIAAVGGSVPAFCKYLKVDSLAAILNRDYDKALSEVEAGKKRQGVK